MLAMNGKKNHIHRLFLCLLFLSVGIAACSDSGLDPETAEVIIGDGRDTNALPDLQKVTLEAGFVGDESKVVTEFVNFRRLTRYSVDTLSDGSVTGLRRLSLIAELKEDTSAGNVRQRLAPLRLLRVNIPYLSVGVTGVGREIDLTEDPDKNDLMVGGIKVILENNDMLLTDADDRFNNWGSAQITSVNERERKIILRITADLLNNASQAPLPPLRRLTLKMVMELPY
ncbi:MAG: hypothetical protein KDD67_01055 [Ignavibacteriae bacterium]|nr:hypothetical protein [Ignavibacteriota bacterium]MCB9217690.1 hypothetical protein [Ignavibacteria bacterium]